MIYTVPDYYKEFQCIADSCEDTCCAGWQIVIDDKTLNKYKNMQGDFGHIIRRKINWFSKTFRQDKEKRCAFLNDCNLCDLYLHEGEKGFCKTCRLYPRHIEEFENVREISLSISCPEVARILLNKKEPVIYKSYEKEGDEEYEDFDPFLFSILEDARKAMLELFQNRTIPLPERVLLVLGMAHDMQGRINRSELFDCFSVIDKYSGESARKFVTEYYEQTLGKDSLGQETIKKSFSKETFEITMEMFDKLFSLELLKEDWDTLLIESQALLYAKGDRYYNEAKVGFWAKERLDDRTGDVDMKIQLEQLLVYFLFTYLPGAVYDGNIFSKVQMSIYCVWMIHELWLARYIKNEGSLSMEERVDLTYRFSREVEHSDKNRNKVEKMMEKKWM